MAGKIITIAQQKGGAGKTTLVAQLAVAFEQAGKSVATVDIDPQGSLTDWYSQRQRTSGEATAIFHSRITGWRVKNEVERLAREYEIVLIDSPPHAETDAKIAVRAAGLVVIPVQPSPMDVWATKPTLKLAASEKVPAMIVFNRVPPRASLTADMEEKAGELDVTIAKARIGNRVALASSMADGKGVVETARTSPAADEIRTLMKEIVRRAK